MLPNPLFKPFPVQDLNQKRGPVAPLVKNVAQFGNLLVTFLKGLLYFSRRYFPRLPLF